MDVGGILFGAALAVVGGVVGGFLFELVKAGLAQRRVRRLFLAVLRVEVPGILTTLDRLADDHGTLGYFPIITVTQLQAQRAGYDRHQTSVVFLRAASLRDEIIGFYQRLAVLAQEVQGIEQLLLQREDMREFVVGKRVEFVGRLRDLATRGRALLPRLTG